MRKPRSSGDVFINCPFDDGYKRFFDAIIFTVFACGFRPRSAREVDDAGEARIEKILRIIESCKYGIHDISRTQLDGNNLPRFNMPFELGVFLGAKRFGAGTNQQKRMLIFDTQPYRYQKFISDLAGTDIHAHRNDIGSLIEDIRDWLANASRRTIVSGRRIARQYLRFRRELPRHARGLDLDAKKLAYADYERVVVGWLLEN